MSTTHVQKKTHHLADGRLAVTLYGICLRPGETVHWAHFCARTFGPDAHAEVEAYATRNGWKIVRTWREAYKAEGIRPVDGKYVRWYLPV